MAIITSGNDSFNKITVDGVSSNSGNGAGDGTTLHARSRLPEDERAVSGGDGTSTSRPHLRQVVTDAHCSTKCGRLDQSQIKKKHLFILLGV